MVQLLAIPIQTTCLHLDSTCLLADAFTFGLGFKKKLLKWANTNVRPFDPSWAPLAMKISTT
jgi:hypothetical protein